MPPKPPSLYDLKKTTIFFAIASIVLLAGLVMMVLQDSGREWKHWQREFMEYSREKAEGQLETARKSVDPKKLAEMNARLAQAQQDIQGRRTEIEKIQQEISKLEVELTKAKTRYQDLKQVQESDRYFLEEARAAKRKEKTTFHEQRMAKRRPAFEEAKQNQEFLEARLEEKNSELAKHTETQRNLTKDIAKLSQDATLLEKKITALSYNWVRAILNAPMLDFIRPSLQVQQIVVESLYDDFYFSKAQKVDRCITCHLAIDQKGFEDAPQPFKTHPKLDLFLSSSSKHPMEEFGCTVCHGGSGQSVSFTTAAHTPRNKEQAETWEKKYHWEAMHHWSQKMLPLNHTEAGCVKCHSGAVEIPQAPKLNEGRRLAREYGCFGCHKVEGFSSKSGEAPWKAGPSLLHVQSKLEQDWIVRWLQNPRDFRPSTKMPRIFHLSNTSEPGDVEKDNALIAGIAAYLIKNSEPVSLQSPSSAGNAKKGAELVKTLGCLGCHSAGDAKANDHGPELSGLGSKVKPEWLFTWLKDPKHYHPETRMPNLRLSDAEAADITAHLLDQRNEKFESAQIPHVKPETVEELAKELMLGTMRRQDAEEQLKKMGPDEKLEFVGKKAINRQGCFGCHDIKGFEDAKNIGTELTGEGSKEVDKLYFGFVDIEHSRQAWFSQKLKEPRIFDKGKDLAYLEKLRMPQFDFTDAEVEPLTTFLLSLQKEQIPLDMRKTLNQKEEKIETGRLLAAKFNCQGCHTLDGKEGKVRAIIEDKGNAPPVIEGEGKKVQSPWLYHFLQNPTPIRPWLQYRMPTFGFKEEELAALVEYFQNLDDVRPDFGASKTSAAPAHELADGQKPMLLSRSADFENPLFAGKTVFEKLQCIKCHKSNPEPGLSASFLAPDLVHAKDRLRPDWVIDWLKDPQAIQPGTMMPAFFAEGKSPVTDIMEGDAVRQIKAMRDYLWTLTAEEAQSLNPAKPAAGPAPKS